MKYVCISRNTQIRWKFHMSIVVSTSRVEIVYFLCLTWPCWVDMGVWGLILSPFSHINSFHLGCSPLLRVLFGSSSSSIAAIVAIMLFSDYCCCYPLLWMLFSRVLFLLLGCSFSKWTSSFSDGAICGFYFVGFFIY